MVSSGGSSYICILAHTNFVPPNTTYWNVVAAKGDAGADGVGVAGADGTDGTGIAWLGAWSGATTYATNDVVEYGGSSYISLVDGNLNSEPPSVNWDLMAQQGLQGVPGADATDLTALLGGATDQYLAKLSATDDDFDWRTLDTYLVWKGPWDSTTAYSPLDLVLSDGKLYLCDVAVGPSVNKPGNDPTNWQFITTGQGLTTTAEVFLGPTLSGVMGAIANGSRRSGHFDIPSHGFLNMTGGAATTQEEDGVFYDALGDADGVTPTFIQVLRYNRSVYEHDAQTGITLRTLTIPVGYTTDGVVRLSSWWFVIVYKAADGKWYVRRYLQSDLSFVDETDIDADVGAVGLYLVTPFVNGSNFSLLYNTSTAYKLSTYNTAVVQQSTQTFATFAELNNYGNLGAVLVGGVVYVGSWNDLTNSLITAWNLSTGLRQTDLEWLPSGSSGSGIAHDGTRFWSMTYVNGIASGSPPLLTNLTVGTRVEIKKSVGPYVGKGTRADEAEMELIVAEAVVSAVDTITVYWHSTNRLQGNYMFDYTVPS